MNKLNAKQEWRYKWIVDFYKSNRYFPSHREMAKAWGVAVSAVQLLVRTLLKTGHLKRAVADEYRSTHPVGIILMDRSRWEALLRAEQLVEDFVGPGN
jgi:hypothetical protein